MTESFPPDGLAPQPKQERGGDPPTKGTAIGVDEPPPAPPRKTQPSKEWRVALWLFLFLNCLFVLTSSGRVRVMDEVLTIYQSESLVTRGDTAIPQAVQSSLFYGKVDLGKQPRAPYPPLPAVLAAPWQIAGRVLAGLPGVPEGARDIVRDFVTVLSSATFAALAAAIFFLLQCALGLELKRAAAVTLIVALSTPLWNYSAYFFSEPLAAALLLFAAYVLFGKTAQEMPDGGAPLAVRDAPPSLREIPLRRAIAGGVALGLLLWVRPTHVIAAPLFIFCVMASERKRCYRTALVLVLVVGVFGVAYLARNDALFGDPFDFGYPAAAEGGKRLNTFETPLLTGLQGLLFSKGKSVFLFAPLILLAIWEFPALWRRNRDLGFVCGMVSLAYLLFYATYTQWEGGYCPGPRYLLPAILLLCVALGPLLAKASPRVWRIALVLCLLGVCVQGISLATSFLEDQARGSYYDAQWNYRMDYSPLVSQTKLLWKYLTTSQPAPMGLGFDRWFVYLHKGGVSAWLIAPIFLAMLAGLIVSGRKLWKVLQPQ